MPASACSRDAIAFRRHCTSTQAILNSIDTLWHPYRTGTSDTDRMAIADPDTVQGWR